MHGIPAPSQDLGNIIHLRESRCKSLPSVQHRWSSRCSVLVEIGMARAEWGRLAGGTGRCVLCSYGIHREREQSLSHSYFPHRIPEQTFAKINKYKLLTIKRIRALVRVAYGSVLKGNIVAYSAIHGSHSGCHADFRLNEFWKTLCKSNIIINSIFHHRSFTFLHP